jgi:hypothetical protein
MHGSGTGMLHTNLLNLVDAQICSTVIKKALTSFALTTSSNVLTEVTGHLRAQQNIQHQMKTNIVFQESYMV